MRLFEIVGSIIILATLFSSVGFSGWIYGENLVTNPNFTNGLENWTLGVWNESGWVMMTPDNWYILSDQTIACSDNSLYRVAFDFRMNDTSLFYRVTIMGTRCDYILKLNAFQLTDDSEEYYPSFFVPDATTITSIGDGWYSFDGLLNTSVDGGFGNESCMYIIDSKMNLEVDNLILELDNVEFKLFYEQPTLNLSIGLSEPADGTRSMSSPIIFSYAVLSNYDVLNCSLVTSTNGWNIKATNSTPVIEGGTLNYIELSGAKTKDMFVWTIACTTAYAPNVQYLDGNRTYIYDPMYAGSVATNILRYAPILLGLFVVLMTFVWVMTKEGEDTISVMIQIGVLYLVLVMMLVIIYGILG